jgi:peptide-methionine (S)-S-oxide reductase
MSIFDNLNFGKALPPIPDRADPVDPGKSHFVNGRALAGPYPHETKRILFAMGCFWGAERKFWQAGEGVYVTAVGYAGGSTRNPTYKDVCAGRTVHAEVVQVVYNPTITPFSNLLRIFWEGHDPTQGMRQGNDVGTQYRSAIYAYSPEQLEEAEASKRLYQQALYERGFGAITTQIARAGEFYFAEEHHQQYLAKNPGGYCGLGGTGVACQIGTGVGTA